MIVSAVDFVTVVEPTSVPEAVITVAVDGVVSGGEDATVVMSANEAIVEMAGVVKGGAVKMPAEVECPEVVAVPASVCAVEMVVSC